MPAASPRNGAGELALGMGLVALAFSFFPIVGEFVAAPAAVLAVVAGSVGVRRADRGLATNPVPAWTGIGLGVAAGLMTLLVFVATSDIA
jgi:tetrahydromethanopterin S-methyltransferase subunit C